MITQPATSDPAVFIHVQFPLCDIRRFIPGEATKLKPLPDWDNPIGRQFLQYFGYLFPRLNEGLPFFEYDNYYADGEAALRFSGYQEVRIGAAVLPPRCLYRRLYSDGRALVKFEVGFPCSGLLGAEEREKGETPDWKAFWKDILTGVLFSVRVRKKMPVPHWRRQSPGQSLPLIQAGRQIAALFEQGTVYSKLRAETPRKSGLLDAGEPALFILLPRDAPLEPPLSAGANTLDLEDGSQLTFARMRLGKSQVVGCFFLREGADADIRLGREWRLGLMGLYAEHQMLKRLIQYLKRPGLLDQSEPLERYLNKLAGRFLLKKNAYFLQSESIPGFMLAYFKLIGGAEFQILEKNFRQIRPDWVQELSRGFGIASENTDDATETPGGFKQRVIELVVEGQLPEALDLLRARARELRLEDLANEIVVLQSQLQEYQRQLRLEMEQAKELRVLLNKVRTGTLELADKIQQSLINRAAPPTH